MFSEHNIPHMEVPLADSGVAMHVFAYPNLKKYLKKLQLDVKYFLIVLIHETKQTISRKTINLSTVVN